MAKRPTPVARCTNCGAPWYNATLINQECGSGKMAAGRYVRKADVAVGYGLVESPWYETKAELSRLASKVTRGGQTGMDVANGRSGEIPCSICSCLDFRMGVDFRR